MMKIRISKQR